jgi:cytochrome P450
MPIPVYRGKGYRASAKAFFGDTLSFMLARQKELGAFYRIRIPWRRLYIASDPDIFQEVLVQQNKKFRKSAAYRQMGVALGQGLLVSEGDFWRQQRRLIQPAFHKQALERLYQTMCDRTAVLLDQTEGDLKRNNEVDLSLWMSGLTSDIALKTMFTAESDRDSKEVARQITDTQAYVLYRIANPWYAPLFPLMPTHWKFRKDMRDFDKTIYGLIHDRRKSGQIHHDLLDLLLHAIDEDSGKAMSDQQLRDELITLYVAGHETSANALAWACQSLLDSPEWLGALQEEADRVMAGDTPTYEEWHQLELTRRFCDEVLRLYPPAHSIGREVMNPITLYDELIPKGSIILLSIYALHRNPDFWNNPDILDPDRFLQEQVANRSKYTWLPFGAGPRLCIGMRFAQLEIPLILASLIKRFDLTSIAGHHPKPSGMLTLKPMPGVRAMLSKRN